MFNLEQIPRSSKQALGILGVKVEALVIDHLSNFGGDGEE